MFALPFCVGRVVIERGVCQPKRFESFESDWLCGCIIDYVFMLIVGGKGSPYNGISYSARILSPVSALTSEATTHITPIPAQVLAEGNAKGFHPATNTLHLASFPPTYALQLSSVLPGRFMQVAIAAAHSSGLPDLHFLPMTSASSVQHLLWCLSDQEA
jgi:hypothetical protein